MKTPDRIVAEYRKARQRGEDHDSAIYIALYEVRLCSEVQARQWVEAAEAAERALREPGSTVTPGCRCEKCGRIAILSSGALPLCCNNLPMTGVMLDVAVLEDPTPVFRMKIEVEFVEGPEPRCDVFHAEQHATLNLRSSLKEDGYEIANIGHGVKRIDGDA